MKKPIGRVLLFLLLLQVVAFIGGAQTFEQEVKKILAGSQLNSADYLVKNEAIDNVGIGTLLRTGVKDSLASINKWVLANPTTIFAEGTSDSEATQLQGGLVIYQRISGRWDNISANIAAADEWQTLRAIIDGDSSFDFSAGINARLFCDSFRKRTINWRTFDKLHVFNKLSGALSLALIKDKPVIAVSDIVAHGLRVVIGVDSSRNPRLANRPARMSGAELNNTFFTIQATRASNHVFILNITDPVVAIEFKQLPPSQNMGEGSTNWKHATIQTNDILNVQKYLASNHSPSPFPWNALPYPSAQHPFTYHDLIARTHAKNLGELNRSLSALLNRAGYTELSYFATKTSFACITRPEQIKEDCSPQPLPYRWSAEIPPVNVFSLPELRNALTKAKVGRYRAIMLIVTDQPLKWAGTATKTELIGKLTLGNPVLYGDVVSAPINPLYNAYFLIYEFRKMADNQPVEFFAPSSCNGLTQLIKAGIIK